MENLKRIIGLAPSELPLDRLVDRLLAERQRVREILQEIRFATPKRRAKKKKKKSESATTKLKKAAAELGLDPNEVARQLAELEKLKEKINANN